MKGLEIRDPADMGRAAWYRSPLVLGLIVLAIAASGYLVVAQL